ncbi:MAG: MFS transporter [bacterium]
MITKIYDLFKNNFHSLFHRNYRYFFIGQLVSLIGTWMQVMAQAWLVYEITNSPFKLGLVSALQFLPTLIFGLFAGVFVDRFPKKKILILTQIMSMIQAFALFFLAYFNMIEYWHIITLAIMLGLTNALDAPARQAYVIELVGRKDVVNAIGLNSVVFNTARIVGPAIAAILMTGLGISWCFFLNGISFIGVIVALMMIKHDPDRKYIIYQSKKMNIIKDVAAGLSYIRGNTVLLKTSVMVLFITLFGFNHNVLIPIFAKTVLGFREKGFGLLLSSLGIGSLIGALSVAVGSKHNPKIRKLMYSSILLGVSLFIIGFTRTGLTTAISIGFCGLFNLWFFTNANSMLQLNSSDEYRGRVMSVYTMVFSGAMPVGNFISGYIAEKIGAAATFSILGAIIFITVISFLTIRSSIGLTGNHKDNPAL